MKGNILQRVRNNRIRKKHEEQLIERMTTHIELLSDELEQIVPRDSPLFMVLLSMAIMKKMEAGTEREPEFQSDLEAGWPNGW